MWLVCGIVDVADFLFNWLRRYGFWCLAAFVVVGCAFVDCVGVCVCLSVICGCVLYWF